MFEPTPCTWEACRCMTHMFTARDLVIAALAGAAVGLVLGLLF